MKLVEFSYDDGNWKLENLRLKDVNLLVGRNAVGKSRTLTMINQFYKFIAGKRNIDTGNSWHAKFINNQGQIIDFEFKTDDEFEVISYELITIDSEVVLSRNFNKKEEISIAQVKSEVTGKLEEIYPPNDKLTLHARRDVRAYPYFEELIEWAEQSNGFDFGHFNVLELTKNGSASLTTSEGAPTIFERLNESDRAKVLSEINQLDFNFSKIFSKEEPIPMFYLIEKGVNSELSYAELSQGLIRSFAILIYFHVLISERKPATIIIDNLCEGLDYERAIKLGKLIFEKCKENDIQLIATTNDNFIMDVVDIEHWNVLTREGSTVTAMNYDTHRELFDDFRLTGLSNFDFFSSDYLQQKV